MLKVEGLTVCRGGRAVLENLSFVLPRGQLTAVLGLNGAGKTTLLKAILGFCPRSAGSTEADGQELSRLSSAERARKLAYVPQRYDGGFRYSIEEFVSMGVTAYLGAFSQPGKDSLNRAKEILAGLGCGELAGRSMDRLSGGECKMAYLARAMMQDASYLLLDEPVSSLDFSRQHMFLDRLRQYVEERQAGCLLTIHSPALAYTYAGRILILHEKNLLLDAERGSEGFDEALKQGLRHIYGPATRVSFQDGALVLGWDRERK